MSNQVPILELNGIMKRFPGVQALNNVHLDVQKGEVHALMGENGAGKSTLIKVIAGVNSIDEGSYHIEGSPAEISTPSDAKAKGVSVIYQELNLVGNLSIAENICFGHFPTKRGLLDRREMLRQAEYVLKEVGLHVDPHRKVCHLSIAQQQLVEIAKALSSKPKVLIMDEPTSALSTREIENLFAVIRRLKAQGVAIIYVSHKLEEVFAIAERITVLRDGCYIATKNTASLTQPELIHLMVGRDVQMLEFPWRSIGSESVLEVQTLSSDHVRDISFHIKAGEIVGFAGMMGAGRSELARAVVGADRRTGGKVLLGGREIRPNSVSAARRSGIGFVPENRKKDGIIAEQSVRFNTTISSLTQIAHGGIISAQQEEKETAVQIDKMHVKVASQESLIATLSGGNQQKVLLGRCLTDRNLKVLIIDEPTRGIDIGAKEEIYQILHELALQGLAIYMISSELPEIMSLCDRVYVMQNGRISGELPRDEMTQERFLSLAIAQTEEQ